MANDLNVQDRLLTEIERQEKYLARLPDTYSFPLFNASQALESQRRSGYRNTASAAREIVDNSIEAQATRIDICFERPKQLKTHQRADSIHAMAFIDNGSGMIPRMAQYALSWGSGTHFDEPGFIGKFGFGLPNASINQTRLVEVYTKTAAASAVSKVMLDARAVKEHGLQQIGDPVDAPLPEFVQTYLDKAGLAFDHGTVVVWVEPDRISYRKPALMKEHLLDDFGVTYRYLLDTVELVIDGIKVAQVDPLFLTPHARYYVEEEKGGAEESFIRTIPVKYTHDDTTGALELTRIEDMSKVDPTDPSLDAVGTITVRVGRFPYGFAEAATKGQKIESDAHRRFEIRKSRRGMSFVRAGREIETVDVFPKSIKDQAKGLGHWPLLQSYAYHWGVEVRFDPVLDEVFGITNDKQTVRPVESLWRLLTSEDVDRQLGKEQSHQRGIRKAAQEKMRSTNAQKSDVATPAETASAAADSMAGKRPRVNDRHKEKAREDFDREAKRRAKIDQSSIDAARKAVEDDAKRRPYLVDFYDESRGPFYKPDWHNGTQVAVLINRQHSFFKTLYEPLLRIAGGSQAKQALDILLIALARAELAVENQDTENFYVTQRERMWSDFLTDAYRSLQQKMEPSDEESAEDEGADDVGDGGAQLEAAE